MIVPIESSLFFLAVSSYLSQLFKTANMRRLNSHNSNHGPHDDQVFTPKRVMENNSYESAQDQLWWLA